MHFRNICRLLLPAALSAISAQAGVVLTMDLTDPTNNIAMDQNYGDRVTAATNAAGSYGTFGSGFTPNILVDYGPPLNTLTRWTTDYGDLVNILENEDDGADRLTITLTADSGFLALLHSFDLGGWFRSDFVIPNLFVKDGFGNNLFAQSNVSVIGATGHSSFVFNTPLQAQILTIHIDLTGLGTNSDNIGIDNVAFSQEVQIGSEIPEPSAMILLGSGFAALAYLRRPKR